jgi:hypothetical protein
VLKGPGLSARLLLAQLSHQSQTGHLVVDVMCEFPKSFQKTIWLLSVSVVDSRITNVTALTERQFNRSR